MRRNFILITILTILISCNQKPKTLDFNYKIDSKYQAEFDYVDSLIGNWKIHETNDTLFLNLRREVLLTSTSEPFLYGVECNENDKIKFLEIYSLDCDTVYKSDKSIDSINCKTTEIHSFKINMFKIDSIVLDSFFYMDGPIMLTRQK